MNIKILDSWLREHLETKATAKQIGEILSLTSVSVERIEKLGSNHLYDIEITTNRPDLMSVVGIAREAAVALNAEGIPSKFIDVQVTEPKTEKTSFPLKIKTDPALTHRVCAAILSITVKKSPQVIKDRLEATDIRSLNSAIDVTNYVMRELGHPVHVFDYDRLGDNTMLIREAKKGEKIVTLDKKEYNLQGGEIIAENGKGELVDLLGIMGLANSVVTDETKRVMLFLDNLDKHRIRKTSMGLGIRTEAAVINEKGVDPELTYKALLRGINLLTEIADGKLESSLLDIYPTHPKPKLVSVSFEKINRVIGVPVPEKQVVEILEGLGFTVKKTGATISATAPSNRAEDIEIPEDIIEEVARMYGYHKLPDTLPPFSATVPYHMSSDQFYWENRAKRALKYWGFTEVYTYSLVSEDMLETDPKDAVKIANPLGTDMAYLRTSLTPSLLEAVRSNKNYEYLRIFELANIYIKRTKDLPVEILTLAGIMKKEQVSFFEVKGILEALFRDLGIKRYVFKKSETATADIVVNGNVIGGIEMLDRNIIDFELNFRDLLKYATLKKTYTPLPKFPAAIEDIRLMIDPEITFDEVVKTIKQASRLVSTVELLDTYEDKKTFRITYQSQEKNLTASDITTGREAILNKLKTDLKADAA
ncbi:MAG: phenylalanine--tRNA ligase subunit beta [Candidatus Levyibacteriota bacterium]